MKLKYKKLRKIILIICLALLIVILAVLALHMINKKSDTKEYVAGPITLNFESRVDKLNSFDSGDYYKFGWVQVQGTNIDIPVLDYSSSGEVDRIDYSYSWMSPNYNSGENRPVILGHNILNVSNEPMLPNGTLNDFEELMAFTYYGFAQDNLYIEYTTEDKDDIYLIYAIGFYDYSYDSAESMNDKKAIDKYIKNVKKNSIYDYDIDVNSDDEILTVKTCTRYFGADEKQQFIIDARKLRDGEHKVKYQVTTNKNFKKLNLKDENM